MNHYEILNYNWDNGLEPIKLIIEDENTDLGTALLIYRRLEGLFIEKYESNEKEWELNQLVMKNICNYYYKNKSISYDPIKDNAINNAQVYKFKKNKTNSILYTKV